MGKRDNYFLDLAKEHALKSPMGKNNSMGYCCMFVKRGKILSVGINTYKTKSIFSNKWSTHAEIDAVLKCKNRKNLRGSKMYLVKLNGIANMCHECSVRMGKFMKKFGISVLIT